MRKGILKMCVSIVMSIMLFTITGCSEQKTGNKITTESAIDQVLEQQVAEQSSETTTEATTEATTEVTTEATTTEVEADAEESLELENTGSYKKVDIDMTTMDGDMVYYTVSNIMAYSDDYLGQVMRFKGNYGTGINEVTGERYHFAVIKDALACCAQGFEFIWEDGTHAWPEEYPSENQEVLITGVFETYKDPGQPYVYARIRNATMECTGETTSN